MTATQELSESRDLRSKRIHLLRETLAYVKRNSAFYAKELAAFDENIHDLGDIGTISPLTKDVLAKCRFDLRCERGLPGYIVFTGGTTGMPQVLFRSRSELGADEQHRSQTSSLPLGLSMAGSHHGHVPQNATRMGLIELPLRNKKNYMWACRMLTEEHQFDGYESKISHLMLPLPALKKLTYFILEQGVDRSLLGIRLIRTYSWYLSSRWRGVIEDVFDAPVIDYFGFAEIQALASECLACGAYHYGSEVVWEIVDPDTNRPLNEGVGKLLVTSLYPGARDHVLIRYEPGDLAELAPFCDHFGDSGFRPLGRASAATSMRTGQSPTWLLLPTQVQEALDYHPWVARNEDPRFSGITVTEDDAFPKWRTRSETGGDCLRIFLEVELKSSPSLFASSWATFRREIRQELLSTNPALAQAIDDGAASLHINGLSPGTLADGDVVVC